MDEEESEIEFHSNETFDDETEDAMNKASSRNGSSSHGVKRRKRSIESEDTIYESHNYEQVRKRLKKLSEDTLVMQMYSSYSGGEDDRRVKELSLKIKMMNVKLESAYQRCILNKQRKEEETLAEPEIFPSRGDPKEIDSRSIYIGNVRDDITEEELVEAFGEYGTVKWMTIQCTCWGMRKGFAFIEYLTKEQAELACKQVHNIRGHVLVVKPKRTNMPGHRRNSVGGYKPYRKKRRFLGNNVMLTSSHLLPISNP